MQCIGTVLFFDRLKGFGFLEAADGRDLFFHHSEIVMPGPAGARKVSKGEQVTYEVGLNKNRGNAIAVQVTPVAPENGGGNERQGN